ncbi:hypothetical protein AAFF_G00255040 [Aldrovandia affinis]|uniref:Uncharacterized protein n=1 Tax=Aldrovandia affinis TaxID=143900 RepID=A0AAD7W2D4_9TELE|nr:hypothetical protein AAFF_G00255040 [Aldrovandia affinis]
MAPRWPSHSEVLLSHIFTDLEVETWRSPEVALFTRLRDNWNLVPRQQHPTRGEHKARWMAKLLYTLKLAWMEQHIVFIPQGTIATRQQELKIGPQVRWRGHRSVGDQGAGAARCCPGLFSTKVPVGERRAFADAILEHKPAGLPMRAPLLRFGTGFGKPKSPALSLNTSLVDLAPSAAC